MLSFRTPHFVWVERNRNYPAATRTSGDEGTEPLNAHGSHRRTTKALIITVTWLKCASFPGLAPLPVQWLLRMAERQR